MQQLQQGIIPPPVISRWRDIKYWSEHPPPSPNTPLSQKVLLLNSCLAFLSWSLVLGFSATRIGFFLCSVLWNHEKGIYFFLLSPKSGSLLFLCYQLYQGWKKGIELFVICKNPFKTRCIAPTFRLTNKECNLTNPYTTISLKHYCS